MLEGNTKTNSLNNWMDGIQLTKGRENSNVRVLVYGNMGTGKTRFAATFPKPFIIDCDKGLTSVPKGLPYVKVPYGQKGASDMVKDIIIAFRDKTKVFAKDGKYGTCETLVLDTISSLAETIIYEAMKYGFKPGHVGKDPGRDKAGYDEWGILGNRLLEIIQITKDIDANIVVTAGIQEEKDENSGSVIGKPEILGSFRNAITKHFDEVYYFYKSGQGDKISYAMSTNQYRWFQGKSRYDLQGKVENPTYKSLYRR